MSVLIVDGHCDVLWKMFENKRLKFGMDGTGLQAGLSELNKAGVKLQLFAIYIDEDAVGAATFEHLLTYTDIFHKQVAVHPHVAPVRSQAELEAVLKGDSNRIGGILSLEGCEALEGNSMLLRTAYRLGVRALGPTWNFANWAGDGAKEPRQGGLTLKGKRLVRECNELGIMLDVSHLSERSFWDLAEVSTKPYFASHSNVYDLCPNPRNLKNEQLKAIIAANGVIGLTFVPYFIVPKGPATIDDLLRHVERVCELGGVRNVAFGSDFDGANECTVGLENAAGYVNLADALYKRYAHDIADGFLHGNWISFLRKHLPAHAL